jgi:hypothetical protein
MSKLAEARVAAGKLLGKTIEVVQLHTGEEDVPHLSTGIPELDALIAGSSKAYRCPGIPRGRITQGWGAPALWQHMLEGWVASGVRVAVIQTVGHPTVLKVPDVFVPCQVLGDVGGTPCVVFQTTGHGDTVRALQFAFSGEFDLVILDGKVEDTSFSSETPRTFTPWDDTFLSSRKRRDVAWLVVTPEITRTAFWKFYSSVRLSAEELSDGKVRVLVVKNSMGATAQSTVDLDLSPTQVPQEGLDLGVIG